jgi:hypothetical protein
MNFSEEPLTNSQIAELLAITAEDAGFGKMEPAT